MSITMQFDPRTGRVLVETDGRPQMSIAPHTLQFLDNDLRDCVNRAIAAPAEKHTVTAHPKRSSIIAFRAA